MEQQSNNIGRRGLDITRRNTVYTVAKEVIQACSGRASTLQIADALRERENTYGNPYDVKSVLTLLSQFRVVGYERITVERPNVNGREGTRKVSAKVAIWTYEE